MIQLEKLIVDYLATAGIDSVVMPVRVDPAKNDEGLYIVVREHVRDCDNVWGLSLDCQTAGIIVLWHCNHHLIGTFNIDDPKSFERLATAIKSWIAEPALKTCPTSASI